MCSGHVWAGTKVGLDQLRLLKSDQTKNSFISQTYSTFAPISLRLASRLGLGWFLEVLSFFDIDLRWGIQVDPVRVLYLPLMYCSLKTKTVKFRHLMNKMAPVGIFANNENIYLLFLIMEKLEWSVLRTSLFDISEVKFILQYCPFSGFFSFAMLMVFGMSTWPFTLTETSLSNKTTTPFLGFASGFFLRLLAFGPSPLDASFSELLIASPITCYMRI